MFSFYSVSQSEDTLIATYDPQDLENQGKILESFSTWKPQISTSPIVHEDVTFCCFFYFRIAVTELVQNVHL
jgi:hypothetical protein